MDITIDIVSKLIQTQFPEYKDLEVYPVLLSGHDNRTFHLGDKMTVRLPSAEGYVAAVEKELQWLPYLAKHLSLPISSPIAVGKPNEDYPFPWSINHYIEGTSLNQIKKVDMKTLAYELSSFLKELQNIPTLDAPLGGLHNYFRGQHPSVYQDEVIKALEELTNLPTEILNIIWQEAISSTYQEPPVWLHGDIAPGNLLMKDGHLCAVIDFGVTAVGDPACDYAMAWTYFDKESREIFLKGLDQNMINRARGWALWKALITYNDTNPVFKENAHYTIDVILEEYNQRRTK